MAGAEFKLTNAIDSSIISDLKNITVEIDKTKKSYADLAIELSKGINVNPKGITELEQKSKNYINTVSKLYEVQNRLVSLQQQQVNILQDVAKKIELLAAPLNKLANSMDSFKNNVNEANKALGEVSQTSSNASAAIGAASKATSEAGKSYAEIINYVMEFDSQAGELNTRLSENKTKLENIRREMSLLSKEYQKGGISEKDYSDKRAALLNNERDLTEANKQYSAVLRNHAAVAVSAAGSYNEMSNAVLQLEKRFKNLSQAQREGIQGKELLSSIDTLKNQLKSIDGQMGNYQRNVGNYASHWNGLGYSVQQVTRELPSLAIGWNTFFLAISNNLPILADEIKKARMEYALAVAENKKAIPVWKQLITSIFSWQTALVAAVTILSVYEKDILNWISSLVFAKKEINTLEEALGNVNKTMSESTSGIGDSIVKINLMKSQWEALGESLELKKKYIVNNKDEFNKLGVNVDNVKEAERVLRDFTPKVIEALSLRAQAAAAYNIAIEKAEESFRKNIQAEEDVKKKNAWDYWNAGIDVLLNFDAALQGINMFDPQKYADARAGKSILAAQAANKEKDAYISLFETLQKQSDKILEDSGMTPYNEDYEDQKRKAKEYADYLKSIREQIASTSIALIKDQHEKEIAQINKDYKDKLSDIKGHSKEEESLRSILAQERDKKLADEQVKYSEELLKREESLSQIKLEGVKKGSDDELKARLELLDIQKEAELSGAKEDGEMKLAIENKYFRLRHEAMTDFYKERYKEQYDRLKESGELELQELSVLQKEEVNALNRKYNAGEMNEKEYKRKLYEITIESNKKLLLAQIAAAEAEVKLAVASGSIPEEKMKELTLKLRELKVEFDALGIEEQGTDNDRKKEDAKELADSIKGITDASRDALGGFADIFDAVNNFTIDAVSGFNDMWNALSDEEKFSYVMGMFSKMATGITRIMADSYNSRIEKVEEEQEANEKSYDEEIERIEKIEDSGAITSEKAEAMKRAAKDKTKKKEEELDKKKSELQLKQAKWEKANSIVQTIIATSVAVSKALPNLILAGIVSAFGAAQVAAIIAQPIPKYAKGTPENGHSGGLAIVGDGGKHETIFTGNGAFITPNISTLVDLPKGAHVLPYEVDLTKLIPAMSDYDLLMYERKEKNLPPITINNNFSELERKFDKLEQSQIRGFKSLEKAIKNNAYQQFSKNI